MITPLISILSVAATCFIIFHFLMWCINSKESQGGQMKHLVIYILSGLIISALLFTIFTCEPISTVGFISNDESIIERLVESKLYLLKNVQRVNDEYFIQYEIREEGIFYWERERYEAERIRIGLPQR